MKKNLSPIHVCSLVLAGVLAVSFSGCRKPEKSSSEQGTGEAASPDDGVVATPVQRQVTDNKGRKMTVEISARSGTMVRMKRFSDQLRFDFPIRDLSAADQAFILRIPETTTLSPLISAQPEPQVDPYIKNRRVSIGKLNKDVAILEIELKVLRAESVSGRPSLGGASKIRQKQKKIAEKAKEIVDLEAEIEIYQLRKK